MELEVPLVYRCCFHLAAEMVDDCVHSAVVAEEGHGLMISVEHAESLFGESADGVTLRSFHRGLLQQGGGIRDAIHTEDRDLAVFIRPADDIIEVPVPGQGIGA